ncbi:MAG TPA: response regulator transcription factor [Candidatus Acidoferrales bacterium]|nr:response regulator transcription factor [Candidatus Acidoferrales bacterium]
MPAKRILVADDNELVRKLLHLMLERDAGWEVATAADGREAISKAQMFRPDVVILDFAMPDMDGLEIARKISRATPSISILLFTLYDSPEMSVAAKEAGVSRVLPKTAAGLPLIEAVEELLTNKSKLSPRNPPEEPVPEPVPELTNEPVNDTATVIASQPIEIPSETIPATMQAEASKSATVGDDGDGPPRGSVGSSSAT